MKVSKSLFILLILLPLANVQSQDIPLFSQKLTNSFIYNPALAGHSIGSVTAAHRSAFNKVDGSGKMNYLSFNMPLVENNFGIGLNVFNEKINFLNTTFASVAFAYHLDFGNFHILSMGLSAEYNNLRPDFAKVVGDVSDEMLRLMDVGDYDKFDFSTGFQYQNQYLKMGVAANRLLTALENKKVGTILSQYYTAQISGLIPIRQGQDLLEPVFTFRKYSSVSHTFDLGMYYTYNNLVLLGGSLRVGLSNTFAKEENKGVDIINLTVGVKVLKSVLLGYSVDIANNRFGGLGLSNEFTLRYDFIDNNPDERVRKRSSTHYKGSQKYKSLKKRKPLKRRR